MAHGMTVQIPSSPGFRPVEPASQPGQKAELRAPSWPLLPKRSQGRSPDRKTASVILPYGKAYAGLLVSCVAKRAPPLNLSLKRLILACGAEETEDLSERFEILLQLGTAPLLASTPQWSRVFLLVGLLFIYNTWYRA